MSELFAPVSLGALDLSNRIVMAPMTRNRATADHVPTDLMAEYYAQRASAGLLISEATQVDPDSIAYPNTPGIHAAAQVTGWRRVTDAVHAAGGRIVLQLWHVGRVAHPAYTGKVPVGPSAIAAQGETYTPQGMQPFVTPRALGTDELPGLVATYAAGARLARDAGFDGVEVHGANGYLLDQFLRDGTNQRTDAYGGSVANRARLLLEVTDAVAAVWGAGRVGVRISPHNPFNDMRDTDPATTFGYVAQALRDRGLAYLHVIEPVDPALRAIPGGAALAPALKQAFGGPLLLNGGFDRALATAALMAGEADAIAFGVPFIANPDLVERLRTGAPLADADRATFYGGDARGYTDYPPLAA